MSDNEERQPTPTPAPEEPATQPSEEAAPSDGGTGRQHNSDSWVIVDDPDSKPAADE